MNPQGIATPAGKDALLALLQARRLPEAKALAEALCRERPQDAEVWQLLGVVQGSLGELQAAEGCFRKAIEFRPEFGEAHYNLAGLLEAQGRLEEAAESYRATLKLNPHHVLTHQRLGNLLARQGRYAEAEGEYREVVRLKPHDAEAHYDLANTMYRLGKLTEAEASYRAALQIKSGFAEVYNNLGVLYTGQGRLAEAIACYQQAVRFKPDHAGAYANLGDAFKAQGRSAEAEASYRQALRVKQDYTETHNALGTLYAEQGRLADAITCYQQALRFKPDHAGAHTNLGDTLKAQGKPAEAEASYRQALRVDPALVEVHINLGILLSDQERPDEAVASFENALRVKHDCPDAYYNLGLVQVKLAQTEKAVENYKAALRLNPGFAEAHHNLGLAYVEQGRFKEAEIHYRQAIQLKPDYSASYANLALVELAQGHFRDAWRLYIYNPALQRKKAPKPPAFLPEDLTRKRFLLTCEQGLGDELFFLRFVPQIKVRGAWVAYCPDTRLTSVLSRVEGIDQVVASGEALADIAYTFSTEYLPLLLGMDDVSKIPAPLPLRAQPERREALRQRLAALGPAPYLGVTWRAGIRDKYLPTQGNQVRAAMLRLYKETPKEQLAEALGGLPGTVLVLQRHPQPGEIEAFSAVLGRPAHDLSTVDKDLEDMLALLSLVDEYVGVSNTNMHLRAGLGRTARVLVPHPPEWRWMAAGEESPWFRGFAVYRQGLDRDWNGAFERIRQDLRRTLASA